MSKDTNKTRITLQIIGTAIIVSMILGSILMAFENVKSVSAENTKDITENKVEIKSINRDLSEIKGDVRVIRAIVERIEEKIP